nr:hypothetical protein [Burkholderia sp. BCC0405]
MTTMAAPDEAGSRQRPIAFSSATAASVPMPFDASGLSPVISLRS